jgi:hypothetical protein
VRGASRSLLLALQGGTPSIAFDVELEDGRVMDQPVDGGHRHGRVGEDLVPFAKGLICGQEKRTVLLPGADQLEQHRCLRLVLADVRKIVQDDQVEASQPIDSRFESQLAARNL